MASETNAAPGETASSPFPWPPVLLGATLLLAGMMAAIAPLPIAPPDLRLLLRWVGGATLVLGVALAVVAHRGFERAGTATMPTRPTSALVTEGIYAHLRNPMYLGMSLLILGLGGLANSWWFPVGLMWFVLGVGRLAIAREEAYLEARFGAAYRDYVARTRRWI